MWETVIAMMASGQPDVTPALGGTWPLEEWRSLQTMHDRNIVKAVLTPHSPDAQRSGFFLLLLGIPVELWHCPS